MERLICDRIEEGIAILEKEDETFIKISLSELSLTLNEGDVLTFDGEKYAICEEDKAERRSKILEMQRKLTQKSKKQ